MRQLYKLSIGKNALNQGAGRAGSGRGFFGGVMGDKASRGPGGTQTRECGAVAHNTHLATANCLTTQTEWSGKCTWSDSPCEYG